MRKEEKLEKTKEKILKATLKLIKSCENADRVTTRAIAKEADVQLAMINYCFGTREALLFEAFASEEDNYKNAKEINEILMASIPPKEKIRRLHYVVSEFLVRKYKFTDAITGYVLLHRDLKKGLNSLPLVEAHYGTRKTKTECKMISYELSSMMQLVIYRRTDILEFTGLNMDNKADREKFIDMQVDLLLEDE